MTGTDALDGELLLPDAPGFEAARVDRVFNLRRPERQPAAILRAASDADVVRGVRLARDRGWSVSVRAGGHSWAAWSIRDDALLIDLGALQDIDYDPATHVVGVRPAVRGGSDLDPFLEERGRFFNGGHCPTVGVGGFLLQGGQGWCARGWGWAAESLVAIDVVTADGELVRADAQRHPDLFWAARGAGPGFPGIVTRFHLATRPRFRHVGKSLQVYPIELFDEVLGWMYGIHAGISPDVEIVLVGLTDPATLGTPEERRVFLVSGVALTGSAEESRAALAPFETCPVLDRALVHLAAVDSSLAEEKADQLRANPEGARYVVDNAWIDGDPADVVAALRPLFTTAPTPRAFTIWFSMAPLRELPDMAFSVQSDAYVASYVVSDDPAEDEANRAWLDAAMRAAEPVTVGQYLGDSDMGHRQLRFLGDAQYARYRDVVARHDPDGLFAGYLARDPERLNRNHWEPEGEA